MCHAVSSRAEQACLGIEDNFDGNLAQQGDKTASFLR